MSQLRSFFLVGLLVGALGFAGVSSAEAGTQPLQRTNAGSKLYMVTPVMMHAINVIVAEQMRMIHRRR